MFLRGATDDIFGCLLAVIPSPSSLLENLSSRDRNQKWQILAFLGMAMWPSHGHQDVKESLLAGFWERVCFWQKEKSRTPLLFLPVFGAEQQWPKDKKPASEDGRSENGKHLGPSPMSPELNLGLPTCRPLIMRDRLTSFLFTTWCHVFCYLQLSIPWMDSCFVYLFSIYPTKLQKSKEWTYFLHCHIPSPRAEPGTKISPWKIFVKWMNAPKSSLVLYLHRIKSKGLFWHSRPFMSRSHSIYLSTLIFYFHKLYNLSKPDCFLSSQAPPAAYWSELSFQHSFHRICISPSSTWILPSHPSSSRSSPTALSLTLSRYK